MKNIIEPHIKSYIDATVDVAVEKSVNKAVEKGLEKSAVRFKAEMKYERELLFEKFQSDLKLMGETIDLKIRNTTREVIREELDPRFGVLEAKMDLFAEESKIFREEMKALRNDFNYHVLFH